MADNEGTHYSPYAGIYNVIQIFLRVTRGKRTNFIARYDATEGDNMAECPYAELGLQPGATEDEVKKAFRKLAMHYHPDKTQGDANKTEKFKRVQAAYDRITKPDDHHHMFFSSPHSAFGNPGFGIPDIFMHMFPTAHVFSGQRSTSEPLPTQTIEIPLSECDVRYGCTRKLEFECADACSECKGSGDDASTECGSCNGHGSIPLHEVLPSMPGVMLACGTCNGSGLKQCTACNGAGTTFRKRAYDIRCLKGVPDKQNVQLKQKGGFCRVTGTNTDLNIVFRYTNFSEKLRVIERDVHIDLDITLSDLLYGFRRILKVYNEQYLIQTYGYIDPNVSHKLENEGLPAFNDAGRNGDLHVHLNVSFPAQFSATQPHKDKDCNEDVTKDCNENIENCNENRDNERTAGDVISWTRLQV
jgi:DnaJ-class molecular chaperone